MESHQSEYRNMGYILLMKIDGFREFFFSKMTPNHFFGFCQQKMIILKKNLAKIVFFSKFDFFIKKMKFGRKEIFRILSLPKFSF